MSTQQERPRVADLVRGDAERLWGTCSTRQIVQSALLQPGFSAACLLRVQQVLWARGRHRSARAVSRLNQALTGAEFMPGCTVGPRLLIRHPAGIVVGHLAVVGAGVTLQHGVTLGEKYADGSAGSGYPVIGDGAVLGTHAVLLGPVEVGPAAVVGAGAVVLSDVPAGHLAVGVPATVRALQAGPISTARLREQPR